MPHSVFTPSNNYRCDSERIRKSIILLVHKQTRQLQRQFSKFTYQCAVQ